MNTVRITKMWDGKSHAQEPFFGVYVTSKWCLIIADAIFLENNSRIYRLKDRNNCDIPRSGPKMFHIYSFARGDESRAGLKKPIRVWRESRRLIRRAGA